MDWAEGEEPELIGWLKKTVHLGGETKKADGEDTPTTNPSLADHKISCSTPAPAPASNGAFSSFPSTFVRTLSLVHALESSDNILSARFQHCTTHFHHTRRGWGGLRIPHPYAYASSRT